MPLHFETGHPVSCDVKPVDATPQDRRAALECVKTLLTHNRKAFG